MLNSQTGARIKTWPTNFGYVRNIRFEDFKLTNVAHPMAIDDFWCDGHNTPPCPPASG